MTDGPPHPEVGLRLTFLNGLLANQIQVGNLEMVQVGHELVRILPGGIILNSDDLLFNGVTWFNFQQTKQQKLTSEIEAIESNKLLNTSTVDLSQFFFQEHQLVPPSLHLEGIVVDPLEKMIDMKNLKRQIHHHGDSKFVKGVELVVEIPFRGNPQLFQVQPTQMTFNPPRATVKGNVVSFRLLGIDLKSSEVKAEIESRINRIQSNLGNLEADVYGFNERLLKLATDVIENRKNRLLDNLKLVADLGFNLRPRPNAPPTYLAPEVRKKIKPTLPLGKNIPYAPEPALGLGIYEDILGIMESLSLTMERSPTCFRSLDEEALRSHFLASLNGQYEGQATGEAFNFNGKTDILIRSGDRNIFIAECKFWDGPKKLIQTIDQLLGYCSWRDTKTAVVIFNRKRDFSKVLASIPETVRKHPSYKKDLEGSSETRFRYLFANSQDRNRELYLTVLAFDVPT